MTTEKENPTKLSGVVHVEFPGKSPNFKRDSESVLSDWVRKLPLPEKMKEELLATVTSDKSKIT